MTFPLPKNFLEFKMATSGIGLNYNNGVSGGTGFQLPIAPGSSLTNRDFLFGPSPVNSIDTGSSSINPNINGMGGLQGQQNAWSLPFGNNMGTWNLGLNAVMGLGQLWNGFQAQKLARDSFNFNKQLATTNLANQTNAYNTQLEAKARGAAVYRNQDPNSAEVNKFIDDRRARTTV